MDKAVTDFLLFLAVVDPVGSMSLFLGFTRGMSGKKRNAVALRAALFAGGILLGFLGLGQVTLDHLGVHMACFGIAGGIILFLFGLQMIFAEGGSHGRDEPGHDVAVFPLAIPGIASPGAILAVVMITDNDKYSLLEQAQTAGVLVVVLVLTWLAMRAGDRIHKIIGDAGGSVIIRVMGILLCGLAVEMALDNVVDILPLLRGGES